MTHPTLSNAELRVLRAMANGLSNGQIAREHCVTVDTVKSHARRLFRKLHVERRIDAVRVGRQLGLVLGGCPMCGREGGGSVRPSETLGGVSMSVDMSEGPSGSQAAAGGVS
ncbi:LuxR C-terminal-related transcriptional regulator [Streptomyces sp. PA03-6a]|nr:LuxR C-terminal-related transcriptional regulator [Streptomyces sp. PA03-6a]